MLRSPLRNLKLSNGWPSFLTGLLKVDRVSRDDNFFNLGGHSLMGAQLIAKVYQRFAVELSLRSLFDHPTIAEISAEIERLLFAKVETMTDEEAQRLLNLFPESQHDRGQRATLRAA